MTERILPPLPKLREINEAERELITALRDGTRKQTKGQLRDGDAFCCLGVACDISGLGGWDGERFHCATRINSSSSMLPGPVGKRLGWASVGGRFAHGAIANFSSLAGLNDAGYTFAQIADVIESGAVELAS